MLAHAQVALPVVATEAVNARINHRVERRKEGALVYHWRLLDKQRVALKEERFLGVVVLEVATA